ncbi:RecT family recombinase [Spiroplasma endosymbiont of Amphimallon solstitiale]|uniref:RecT family recombinase n=1 Tax=Spiroplasma endosymbiont of Amphimallon solstitiale TaxID=3066288 RepID=UPI00313DD5C9
MANLILPKTITQNQINDFKKYYEITKLNDKKLSTFNPQSLLNTLATIFELNLSNNPIKKELALIPYGNELQVQIQEDGFLTLLQRSNCVIDFQREIITNKHIYNDKTKRWEINPAKIFEPKEIIGYYGMICIKDYLGKNITFIKGMTKQECEEHRKKYSKANGNSPWNTSFDAMALKTVIKAIIRDINKNPSIKLENQNLINKALQVDQSAIIDEEIVYIDNPNTNNVLENNTNFQQLEENINKLDNLVFKNE